MGAISTVGFKAADSVIHRLDPRTKQIFVMVMSSACFFGGHCFLMALSLVVVWCFFLSKQQLFKIIAEIKLFLFFLLVIFLVRSLSLGDLFIPVTSSSQLKMALLFCWRLLLVVLMGVLLISTTKTSAIRAALIWGLSPLPFINEKMAATMVGLVVRFIPLILLQAADTGDAMKARCIEARKKPGFRLTKFTIMLFKRTFSRADDLVDAMQARCYNDDRTLPALLFNNSDRVAAGLSLLLLLTAIV